MKIVAKDTHANGSSESISREFNDGLGVASFG